MAYKTQYEKQAEKKTDWKDQEDYACCGMPTKEPRKPSTNKLMDPINMQNHKRRDQ